MARPLMMADDTQMGMAPEAETPEEPMTDMAEATEDESGQVVCTILRDADGRFRVIHGDEPEPGGEMGMAGAPADEGQTYEGIGATLKAVMDCLQEAEQGQGQEAFDAGFGGEAQA